MSPRERQLIDLLQTFLGESAATVDPQSRFDALGLDSLSSLRFARKAEESLGIEVDLEWFYDHPTVQELARHLDMLADAPIATAGRDSGL
ncbi:acyl carrier protein [Xanthomonas sp. D-109]|uniref:acyl carrier protein n=1 Tax=Xanthomonas sp. D-109 TaxID=2821274 RepID=UPI001ADA497B|nr:acyl carrier protein [Xanthomonas sp. D-109]MBO9883278.1 acyl carrier protein [Xanthomonas sp. D-109]